MYDFHGKTVAVIGLGISNTPLLGWLLDRGALMTLGKHRVEQHDIGLIGQLAQSHEAIDLA